MRTLDIDIPMHVPNFDTARRLALEAARSDRMESPMIVAWHDQRGDTVSPGFEGGDPEAWWRKFGRGNRGELEISVSGAYEFILTDSRNCETLDEMPLSDLRDAEGNSYVCCTSLLHGSHTPNAEACVPADEWLSKQT